METTTKEKVGRSAGGSVPTPLPINVYQEICGNIRATDEISFKLLGTVPLVSGVGAGALTVLEKSQLLAAYSDYAVISFSALGALVTFGLYRWEMRNIQKCRWLIARAADFEQELLGPKPPGQRGVQFVGWSEDRTPVPSIFKRPWGKTQAEKFIYGGAIAAWFVPLMIVLLKNYWPRV
ncbi:MAG TPA: hypothetical protein VF591_10620 [Pyrinomonadaceae bacterium]